MFGNGPPRPPGNHFPPPPPFYPAPRIPGLPPSHELRHIPPPDTARFGWPPAPLPPPLNQSPFPPPWSAGQNPHTLWPGVMRPSQEMLPTPAQMNMGPSHSTVFPSDSSSTAVPRQKSRSEVDNEWISSFLLRCKFQKETKANCCKTIKISEAKEMHIRAYKLIKILEESRGCETSEEKMETILNTKSELDQILKSLSSKDFISDLSFGLKKRAKKRRRCKNKKREIYERKEEMKEKMKQKHIEIDKWMEEKQKYEDDIKREKKVQKDLDEYLREIRQKQANAQKYLDIFNLLAKLRKVRADAALRKGTAPSESHDEVFKNVHESATKKIQEHISSCKEEEKFMKKFMTEEQQAEEKRIAKKLKEDEEDKRSKWKKERSEVLFGCEGDLEHTDPLWPVQEIHNQASNSFLGLISTRAQWDRYIFDGGSRIANRWVEPSQPSSEAWEEYLATT